MKVKKTEEKKNWPKSKKAESNVWPKIIRTNITFGRKQKGQIETEKSLNSYKEAISRLFYSNYLSKYTKKNFVKYFYCIFDDSYQGYSRKKN